VTRRKRQADRQFDAVAEGRRLPEGRLDDPEDVDALRAAIELRGAVPAADLPSEAFVAGLRDRLAREAAPTVPVTVSRRSLLASAGAVAAGAVAAGAAGVALDRAVLAGGRGVDGCRQRRRAGGRRDPALRRGRRDRLRQRD